MNAKVITEFLCVFPALLTDLSPRHQLFSVGSLHNGQFLMVKRHNESCISSQVTLWMFNRLLTKRPW